ncbi:hypothetical protein BHE74_00047385 [Ensete ventricosum]|nr:hypothetical protein BHE74_00047385 [Ensete ventricosum]
MLKHTPVVVEHGGKKLGRGMDLEEGGSKHTAAEWGFGRVGEAFRQTPLGEAMKRTRSWPRAAGRESFGRRGSLPAVQCWHTNQNKKGVVMSGHHPLPSLGFGCKSVGFSCRGALPHIPRS